jgi:two-component system nitrate/nitrite response regulator NarL
MNSNQPVTVLIVEDHFVTARGLKDSLSEHDSINIVGIAGSLEEALVLLRRESPEVILLDLHLPDKFRPKQLIESLKKACQAAIIVFSNESRPAFVQAVLSLDVSGYLLKSEQPSGIAAAIVQTRLSKGPFLSKELLKPAIKFTSSERHILQLIAKGLKYAEIAEARNTSPQTVRKQCDMLLVKLDLDTRESLVSWAAENGFGQAE